MKKKLTSHACWEKGGGRKPKINKQTIDSKRLWTGIYEKEISLCLHRPHTYKYNYLHNIHDTGNEVGRVVGCMLQTTKCVTLNV